MRMDEGVRTNEKKIIFYIYLIAKDKCPNREKTLKRNRKNKSDTHERKFNCVAKASVVRKVLFAHEPLYLLYCKDNRVYVDNSSELTISASPCVEPLL